MSDPYTVYPRPPGALVNPNGSARPEFYRFLTDFAAAAKATDNDAASASDLAQLEADVKTLKANFYALQSALEVLGSTGAPAGGSVIDVQARAAITMMLNGMAGL